MTQPRLAQLLGYGPDTIGSAENAYRNLSEKLLKAIEQRLGFRWSKERKEWLNSYPSPPASEKAARLWRKMDFDREKEADALANGLISLLLRVSKRQFTQLSDELFLIFQQKVKDYEIPTDGELQGMSMLIEYQKGINYQKLIRQRAGWNLFNGRSLLDFRYRINENQPLQMEPLEPPKYNSRKVPKNVGNKVKFRDHSDSVPATHVAQQSLPGGARSHRRATRTHPAGKE
jgi:transcriptional regulator with XRE-family HTH domain